MHRADSHDERTTLAVSTRRLLLKQGSVLSIAGLAGLTGAIRFSTDAFAQTATPTGEDGLIGSYVAVRSRQLTSTHTAAEVMASIEEGYVPLLKTVAGFKAYLGIADPVSRSTAFIVICADQAGTDTSTQLAGKWLSDNNYDYFEGDPIIVEGPIRIAVGDLPTVSAETSATPVASASASASPEALAGDTPFVVIRARKVKEGKSADELVSLIETGFVPIVSEVPGFISYIVAVNAEASDQFAITIGEDQAAVEESTKRAGEWGQQGASDYVEGDPTVLQGALLLSVVKAS